MWGRLGSCTGPGAARRLRHFHCMRPAYKKKAHINNILVLTTGCRSAGHVLCHHCNVGSPTANLLSAYHALIASANAVVTTHGPPNARAQSNQSCTPVPQGMPAAVSSVHISAHHHASVGPAHSAAAPAPSPAPGCCAQPAPGCGGLQMLKLHMLPLLAVCPAAGMPRAPFKHRTVKPTILPEVCG